MPIHSTTLLWLVATPLLGGLLTLLLPLSQQRNPWWGGRAIALATALVTLTLAATLARHIYLGATSLVSGTVPTLALHLDALSTSLALLIAALQLLAALTAAGIQQRTRHFFLFLQLFSSAALLFLAAGSVLTFGISLFALILLLYLLIAGWANPPQLHAARRFFIMTLLAALCVIISLAIRAHPSGELLTLPPAPARGTWDFWLMLLGLATLMALFPFHGWRADVLDYSIAPVAILAAAVFQTLAGIAAFRFLPTLYAHQLAGHRTLLASLATITFLYAALAALRQTHLKRITAFFSMSLMGLFFLALIVDTPTARTGAIAILFAQPLSLALLLIAISILHARLGHQSLTQPINLTSLPGAAAGISTALLAAVGLPILCLFPGILLILLATFQASRANPGSHPSFAALAAVIAIAWCTLLITALWTCQRLFSPPPRPDHTVFKPLTFSERWMLLLLSLAALTAGIFPAIWLPDIS